MQLVAAVVRLLALAVRTDRDAFHFRVVIIDHVVRLLLQFLGVFLQVNLFRLGDVPFFSR